MKKTQDPNNCFLNTMKHYSYIKEWIIPDINKPNLTYTKPTYSFRDSLPRNFLMILAILLPVSWMVAKFSFIGIILEDTIALHAYENIICNICIYQPETDTLIGIIEDTIVLHGEK